MLLTVSRLWCVFPYSLTPSKLVDIYSVNEYSFDLPVIVAEKESFAGFVESLTRSSLPEDDIRVSLEFESILRYVACPSLPSDMSDVKKNHTDIQSVLEWLHKRKRVESVMELRILDRLWGSHDEACIAYWLDEFKVSRAHWRCQDLSFYSFKDVNTSLQQWQKCSSRILVWKRPWSKVSGQCSPLCSTRNLSGLTNS
jgi:hypothetical protein